MTTTMSRESGGVVMVIAFFFTVHVLVVMMAVTFIVHHVVTTLPPPVLASSGRYDAARSLPRRRRMCPATPSAAFSFASSPVVSHRAPPVALARIFGPSPAGPIGGGGDRRRSSSNSCPTASVMMMLDDYDEGYVEGTGTGEVSPGAAAVASDAQVATMDDATATLRRRRPPKWSRCLNGVTIKSSALNEAVVTLCNSASPPLDPPITLEDANELVDIGAVWARMDPLTEGEILAQYEGTDADDRFYEDEGGSYGGGVAYYPAVGGSSNANVRYGDLPKGWGAPKSEQSEDDDDVSDEHDRSHLRYRRLLSPCVIPEGVDLRVYPYPRRFTSPCRSLTPSSILHEDTTYIVVDKPPMLPTQPDASNYKECCPGCVDDVLGPFYGMDGRRVTGRPLLCHRVDTCVGGCVVLSKDARGQKVFSEFQRDRKVKKLYLTLTTEPVPLGRHVHWMWAPAHSRRRRGVGSGGGGDDVGPPCQFVSHAAPSSRRVAKDFWIRCVLEVTRSEPIEIDEDVMAGGHHPHDDADGGGGGNDDRTRQPPRRRRYYQSTVRLVTGRKHQVRAQLASLGCPIVRDTLYGPIAGMTLDRLGSDEDGATEDQMDEAVSRCRVPTEPIGLQAHAILFGGVKAKAGRPWWAPGR